MYKPVSRQIKIELFDFPLGELDSNNRWVHIAQMIPWDEVEDIYMKSFTGKAGAPAFSARTAFGALLAKQILDCSDRELCEHIAENPYLQFLIGRESFEPNCPFAANSLTYFRKRFSDQDITKINDLIVASSRQSDLGGSNDEETPDENNDDNQNPPLNSQSTPEDVTTSSTANENTKPSGTLAMDATVAPSDISFPQDVKLLNEAREKLENMIDIAHEQTEGNKPRTYRVRARKEYLSWSKCRKRGYKKTRKAIKQQLGYVSRDIGHVEEYLTQGVSLNEKDIATLEVIKTLYEQQKEMYVTRTHSVPDRIVSISQSWVRPIVRGKATANTEFGAKVHAVLEDGLARIDYLSFDAYNESSRLKSAVEGYKSRYGHMPERILADKIYHTRPNIAWCKEQGIRLSGPKLGRPSKDESICKKQRQIELQDGSDRNAIEGLFGTTKNKYGMNRIAAHLEETTKTVIAMAVLSFNIKKLLAFSFYLFLMLPKLVVGILVNLSASRMLRTIQ